MTGKAPWRVIFESYACPTCGAPPGVACTTVSGKPTNQPHADRTRMADRCPVCGVIVADAGNPGRLCPRCALVRALEVERSTTWQRED